MAKGMMTRKATGFLVGNNEVIVSASSDGLNNNRGIHNPISAIRKKRDDPKKKKIIIFRDNMCSIKLLKKKKFMDINKVKTRENCEAFEMWVWVEKHKHNSFFLKIPSSAYTDYRIIENMTKKKRSF